MVDNIYTLVFHRNFYHFHIQVVSVYLTSPLAVIFPVILELSHVWEFMLFAFICKK